MKLASGAASRVNIPFLFKQVIVDVTSDSPVDCYIVEQKKLRKEPLDLMDQSDCYQLNTSIYQQVLSVSRIAYCLIIKNNGSSTANIKISVNTTV